MAEWDDVAGEARTKGEEIHSDYLSGIMVEKRSEFLEGDERPYFKYRVVFQGKQVQDSNWATAMFNEMASTPATMEASELPTAVRASFEGHKIESRDVEQAYLQAKMEGLQVYITLPKELWTPAMHETRCLVFRLERTLYGHKHSGV